MTVRSCAESVQQHARRARRCRRCQPAGVLAVLLGLLLAPLAGAAPLWIDVRSAEEFAAGHVPGAHHIHYSEIGVRINELTRDPDADIRVYCAVGVRAQVAKLKLEFAGYRNVTNEGGLAAAQTAWKKAGGNVECGAPSSNPQPDHEGGPC